MASNRPRPQIHRSASYPAVNTNPDLSMTSNFSFAPARPALTTVRDDVQLKVVNWRGEVTASEPITDLAAASSADAGGEVLSAFYPIQTSLPIDERLAKAPSKAEYKWWPDGYEPIYYILTPQARSEHHQLACSRTCQFQMMRITCSRCDHSTVLRGCACLRCFNALW